MADKGYACARNEFSTRELSLGWLLGATLLSVVKAQAGRPHSHGYLEIIYCLKGEFVYAIDRRQPVRLKSGMGIVIPEHTNHPLRGGVIQPGLRLVLHISSRPSAGARSAFTTKDLLKIRQDLLSAATQPFRLNRTLQARLKELAGILQRPKAETDSIGLAHFRVLCEDALFRTALLQRLPPGPAEPRLMEDAVAYLDTHFAEPLPIDILVRRIGYSRSRFFDLFREHTGLTPHEYLVRLRIRKAEALLRSSATPVRAVAQAVGFADYIHFTSVFKRYTGCTASEIRLSGRTP